MNQHRDNILTIEDGILITFKDSSTSFIRTGLRSKENKGDAIPNGSYIKSTSHNSKSVEGKN